jgi:hypothetical protein
VTKNEALQRLGSIPTPPTQVRVQDQDVGDIMQWVTRWHKECTVYYDRLYTMFDKPGSWMDVGQRLFDFCKQNIAYDVESVKWQYLSSPMSILRKGHCDCKGYALFIGGVIDAMKRAGEEVDWCYRFASYSLLNSTPGHVFIVINPGTDNIWVDPVLDTFNTKFPRPVYKQDRYVDTCRSVLAQGVGYLPGAGPLQGVKLAAIGISNTEQALLNSVYEYANGVNNAIATMNATSTLNTICTIVLATASVAIPVIAAALAVLKAGSIVVSDTFGAGSEAAMLIADIANNPLTAPVTIVETILNGRTYQSDQYRAAQFYQWYVLSNTKDNALNKTPDSDVIPALKWFVDRLGVFISGAEHIIALTQSPAAYMALYSVNNYTTMDQNRVNAAYNVASAYFTFNNVPGAWANTVGVYDTLIAQVAAQQNESIEVAAAQADYTNVYSSAATSGPAAVTETPSGGLPIVPLALLGLAGLILLIPSKN